MPDRQAREQILAGKTRNTRLAEDVDLAALATRTAGMSGAELESLINVAAMKVGFPRGCKKRRWREDFFASTTRIFSKLTIASAWVPAGIEWIRRCNDEHCRRFRGVSWRLHECGHAMVAMKTPGAAPIDKITVIPRGDVIFS